MTVGKVFFQMGSSLYVCSGNAVDDVEDGVTTPNLVVTAGHCVNDGGSAFATNFMFIPRYDPAAPRTSGQPDGTFTATRLTTTSQWAAQGADKYNYDVGMARVGVNEHGETLAAAIGDTSDIGYVSGDPTSTGGVDYTVNTHSFGYPAARPYDGTTLISCWGGTTGDTVGGSTDYRLPCNMTGGSSGGPWLLDSASAVAPLTENADVSDVQISVNSFGYRGEKNAMYGPIFGTTIQNLSRRPPPAADRRRGSSRQDTLSRIVPNSCRPTGTKQPRPKGTSNPPPPPPSPRLRQGPGGFLVSDLWFCLQSRG